MASSPPASSSALKTAPSASPPDTLDRTLAECQRALQGRAKIRRVPTPDDKLASGALTGELAAEWLLVFSEVVAALAVSATPAGVLQVHRVALFSPQETKELISQGLINAWGDSQHAVLRVASLQATQAAQWTALHGARTREAAGDQATVRLLQWLEGFSLMTGAPCAACGCVLDRQDECAPCSMQRSLWATMPGDLDEWSGWDFYHRRCFPEGDLR